MEITRNVLACMKCTAILRNACKDHKSEANRKGQVR